MNDNPCPLRKHWRLVLGVGLLLILLLSGVFLRKARQDDLARRLVLAARQKDFREVSALLDQGADPDGCSVPYGDSHSLGPNCPLILAAEAGDIESVTKLIDAGANFGSNIISTRLIEVVLAKWDYRMLELLLKRGLDLNRTGISGDRSNVLHAVIDATWREHHPAGESLNFAKLAIAHGCDVNHHGMHGDTPLIDAVGAQQKEMVQFLLDCGAVIQEKNGQGWDAMDMATFRSNAQLVDILVEHGGRYTIQEAVALGRAADVRKMLGDDPSLVSRKHLEGKTLAALALERGNEELAMLLLEKGADLSVVTDRGESLLHLAAMGGSAPMVRYLIDHGADVMARDAAGDTPLHETTYSDRDQAAALLIAAGSDVKAPTAGFSKITPLLWASSYNSPNVIRLLIKAGANPNAVGSYDGSLPLGSACQYSAPDTVPESIRVLLELGADVNAIGSGGRPAIHWAAGWFGREPLVRFLLEHGADPTIRDRSGDTALDIAEREGKEKVAAMLREWQQRRR